MKFKKFISSEWAKNLDPQNDPRGINTIPKKAVTKKKKRYIYRLTKAFGN